MLARTARPPAAASPLAIVALAALPARRTGSSALIPAWTPAMSALDIAWGTALTATSASFGLALARYFGQA